MASTLLLWLAVAVALALVVVLTMQAFDPIIGAYNRYIAWTENSPRTNAVSILAKAVAKPLA